MTNFDMVREFHEVYDQARPDHLTLQDNKLQDLRLNLIAEELEELGEALDANDIVGVADALADLLYVVYGAGVTFGIDLDACFAEVHRSNMSKLDENGKPIYREDGKVLKGPNFTPPNLAGVLGVEESPS